MYTVQSGDTLSRIAQKSNARVEDIIRANPSILNPDQLRIGQRLIIPAGNGGYRPLSDGGNNSSVLDILRQGSVMFTTSFYSAYHRTMSSPAPFLDAGRLIESVSTRHTGWNSMEAHCCRLMSTD